MVVFCRHFLPAHGDRTVDQMMQAARSCKQNIAEGSAAAGRSLETQSMLTNVARVKAFCQPSEFLFFHVQEWDAVNCADSPERDCGTISRSQTIPILV